MVSYFKFQHIFKEKKEFLYLPTHVQQLLIWFRPTSILLKVAFYSILPEYSTHMVHIKLEIYIFITITGSVPELVDLRIECIFL